MAAKLARFSWLPGGLAAALVVGVGRLIASPSSGPLELGLYDRVLEGNQLESRVPIVIAAIDQDSVQRLGDWPWPRDVHASLLDRLRSDGVSLVAFTEPLDTAHRTSELERVRAALALLEASELGNSAQARQLRALLGESATARDPDAHLADAITLLGDVVLPVDVRLDDKATAPIDLPPEFLLDVPASVRRDLPSAAIRQSPASIFTDTARAAGHTYLPEDSDGKVRSDAAAVRVGNVVVPSLALAIAARAANVDPSGVAFQPDGSLRIADRIVRPDDSFKVRPQYEAPGKDGGGAFRQYPYWQILAGEVPSSELRGRIVIVGFTDSAAGVDTSVATAVHDDTPAVFAIASAAASMIEGTTYSRPGYAIWLEWAAAVLVVVFAALVVPSAGLLFGGIATVLLAAGLLVTEIGLLGSAHLWVRLLIPCIAVLAGYGMYTVGELIRRANTKDSSDRDSAGNLRRLGQTFQQQGQLDLAFETYRRCPMDAPTMELLYLLGLDFERRAQLQKASNVYAYIATRDPNYRDLRTRRARVREEPLTRTLPPKPQPPAYGVPPEPRPKSEYALTDPTLPARTLGRYEIERELGKGAMGVVYLGRDPKINRVVAIKAIPLAEEFEEDDLAEARARFFREAEMAGRLNHPAIVTVYDAGEDQGLAYIAMEYLRGQHLSHYADPKRLLPPKSVMLLVARVADALHYAHRQNVVHRDIKPANIMFNPDSDELKITDFGIARLTDTSRTKTGIVLGTPSFMSPEQLEGRTLDGRSDQFALGVSLYQLLCGQLPFRAESMPRLMQKIATEPHASVRLVRPELPECIDKILDRVLSKSADDRYATCAELALALRECAGPQEAPRSTEASHEWLIP